MTPHSCSSAAVFFFLKKKNLLNYLYISVCVGVYMHASIVVLEARKGNYIPWIWSYQLLTRLKNLEIGKMLIYFFHYYNRSCSHEFIAVLATFGLNFPTCLSDPILFIPLVLYFFWDKVPIPRNWIFVSWRGQTGCQDLGEIIVTSMLMSTKPSIAMSLIHIRSFVLW